MKNLIFTFFVLFSLSLAFNNLNAQVSVAFVGISNDSPDDFSFVAVSDIPANTVIHFTDEEYRDATEIYWFLPCGRIVGTVEKYAFQ